MSPCYLGPLGEGVQSFLLQQLGDGWLPGVMEALREITHGDRSSKPGAARVPFYHWGEGEGEEEEEEEENEEDMST